MSQGPALHRLLGALLATFAVVFVPAFIAIGSWSLAMPRDSGPDEPSHVVHAAAVIRGVWVGSAIPAFPGFTQVQVPSSFAYLVGLHQEGCFQSPATKPASCQPPWPSGTGLVTTQTYTGHYPPLYYAIVGLPTLISSSIRAFYAMRLMGALVSALFLGLAAMVVAIWSRNRMLRVGILLAATPMALYSAAVVNPSGLEICSALCLWVSGVVLVRERLDDPPPALVVIVGASAAVLALSRPISPLWLLLIGAALLAMADTRRVVDLIRRRRLIQIALGSVGVVTILAVAWVLLVHAFDVQHGLVGLPKNASALDVLSASVRREGVWLQEMVGIFGSHETLAPLLTFLAWWIGVGVLAIAALVVGRRRDTVILVTIVGACVLVPIAIQFLHARDLGIVWQGRYALPAAVGIPILGSAVIGESAVSAQLRRGFELAVVAVMPIAGFLAFAAALRRYAVGVDGPIFFVHPKWQPAGGVVLWLAVNLGATAALTWAVWRARPSDSTLATTTVRRPSSPADSSVE